MEDEIDGSQLLAQQLELERAARRKFPWDPRDCTLYMDIAPRQLLFACLTCQPANAICYACGLRCHANHEIVELDTKRGFRCDCGTAHIHGNQQCCLRRTEKDPASNPQKTYGHNFEGRFCVCEESANDESYGQGAMFQCLLGTRCTEDWFHARCIVGISREEELNRQQLAESYGSTGGENVADDEDAEDDDGGENDEDEMSGDDLDATFPEIPSDFGGLICPRCAVDVPQLINSSAVLVEVNGYYFLKENYGEIAARNFPHLIREFPFLDGKEESYRPERDNDRSTLLEAGERALSDLPHETVLNGLEKFNAMKESLMNHLKTVGGDGHVITREDIEAFFSRGHI